ncbi:MAG: L-malate glycosyltransferase [Thermoleophilaceae bacterium]|nr:L-malate glycosyltransferase [Thermoleophilaceae bacterium]
MLTDHLPHGDGLVAHGFVRELGARGHELHVAAGGVDLRDPLPANVHVHRLRGPVRDARGGRLGFMRQVRALYRRLAAEGPFDLAHQLNPVDVGLSLALAGERVPVVLGPYVPDWAPSGAGADGAVGPAALRLKAVLRAAQQRRAAAVLLSTAAATPKLARGAAGRLGVHELPPGIDDRAWCPAERAAGQDVLFLANLEVRKGIHVLLDAFARLSGELPAARLLVAGLGPEEERVRRRVRESPELRRVELLGRVERDSVMAAMQACDVYCLPSYGEPYGMTALEAMACGRPVVGTAAGGLQHLVPDAGGRKVPVGDSGALAAALAELLGDPGLRRSMGEHNRALVEQRYAWTRVATRLEEVYEEALSRAR